MSKIVKIDSVKEASKLIKQGKAVALVFTEDDNTGMYLIHKGKSVEYRTVGTYGSWFFGKHNGKNVEISGPNDWGQVAELLNEDKIYVLYTEESIDDAITSLKLKNLKTISFLESVKLAKKILKLFEAKITKYETPEQKQKALSKRMILDLKNPVMWKGEKYTQILVDKIGKSGGRYWLSSSQFDTPSVASKEELINLIDWNKVNKRLADWGN